MTNLQKKFSKLTSILYENKDALCYSLFNGPVIGAIDNAISNPRVGFLPVPAFIYYSIGLNATRLAPILFFKNKLKIFETFLYTLPYLDVFWKIYEHVLHGEDIATFKYVNYPYIGNIPMELFIAIPTAVGLGCTVLRYTYLKRTDEYLKNIDTKKMIIGNGKIALEMAKAKAEKFVYYLRRNKGLT